MSAQSREEWLAGLRVGDEVMQVHDSDYWPPKRFTVVEIAEEWIRIKRLTTLRRFYRLDGKDFGGFSYHIEPVSEDSE